MANTKIPVELSSTPGIVDNSNATAITIDSSENVGIGTTSPNELLEIKGTEGVIRLQQTGGAYSDIRSSDFGTLYLRADPSNTAASSSMRFHVDASERMRIDTSGNVGIGTSSPVSKLTVSGQITAQGGLPSAPTYSFDNDTNTGMTRPTSDTLTLVTAGTERMRILSSGEVCIGKTSADLNTAGFHVVQAGSVYSGIAPASNSYHLRDTTNNTWEFYVSGAGQIHATSTSITSLSDERLKENIKDLETGLKEVMSLKPRRFDWKDRKEKNVAGFIAQEVETVLPDLIDDFMHDDLKDAKSVKMSDMIPTLVKAIQEQQAQIEALQSEINELKNS